MRSPAPAARVPISYRGVELPPPDPRQSAHLQLNLPPAWLIVNGRAVVATYGSYTWQVEDEGGRTMGRHGDMVPPQLLSSSVVATATVVAGDDVTLVVGSESITALKVTTQDWDGELTRTPELAGRELQTTPQLDAELSSFTLQPVGEVRNQLFLVSATFDKGRVVYFWRLNPGE